MIAQLDLWPDEVAALPWGGQSPRALARELVDTRIKRFQLERTCGVDNSVVRCPSREAHYVARVYPDAAQFMCLISDEAPSMEVV